ncbi:metalloregulator ArsR/SmtB family transcription factor [Thalassobaculum sp. OXR-137]|uniref:ArsR/SmtB family transcription factor n=1 Tax=Thalassobaculum sp. OXR-137 TaxID=3100173 RepID=UPI002AC92E8B|nr:metalloregulator ArsR/SmtB family transcription factor [Thalassobaculum sp. OXR-137]WPZ36523.1 metalloregulator ArsR/SmtB family transcription factor [Thalassobaculum sp. OXR-137]
MTQLDQTFAALGDGTRRAILARLTQGEAALSEIAEPFEMSQTAVSKHVRVLSEAGLVRVSKRGRTRYCRLEAAPMKQAAEWLETYQKFWEGQFDALARYLEENP